MSNLVGPANAPLFNPAPVRGATQTTAPTLPRFGPFYIWSWPGLLNYVDDVFPEIAVASDVTLISAIVIQKRATADLTFDVTVNGVVVDSFTVPAVSQSGAVINVTVSEGDRVCVVPTSVGVGTADLVTIQLLDQIASEVRLVAGLGFSTSYYDPTTYGVILLEDARVILAGSGGVGARSFRGLAGALDVTMAAGTYILSVGSGGGLGDWNESWGYGGAGNWWGSYSGPDTYTGLVGGGRSELRTGTSRHTAIVIAPGGAGSGSSGETGHGLGGFPDGTPAVSTGGGYQGYSGTGATATSHGVGGEGWADTNDAYDGDGAGDGGVSGDAVYTPEQGSGGQAGRGSVSFGSGGAGGGGGGGWHGGGGGAGANGSSSYGRSGGGGSGLTTGAKTVNITVDGINQTGVGYAIVQSRRLLSTTASRFSQLADLVAYVPCEEEELGKVAAFEVITGQPFILNTIQQHVDVDGGNSVAGFSANLQTDGSYARGSRRALAVGQTRRYIMHDDAHQLLNGWNPPELNAGLDWCVEWSGKSSTGTVQGPSMMALHSPGSFPNAAYGNTGWEVWATATVLRLRMFDSGGVYKDAAFTFPSLSPVDWHRYGISYNSATDTFSAYRDDGQSVSLARSSTPIPTTGRWQTVGRPALDTEVNTWSVIQDVAIFDAHRTSTDFQAAATILESP